MLWPVPQRRASELAYYPRAPVLSTVYPDPESDLQIIKEIVANRIIHLAEAPFALRCLRWLPAAMREPVIECALKRALVSEIATCEMRTLSEVVSE